MGPGPPEPGGTAPEDVGGSVEFGEQQVELPRAIASAGPDQRLQG